MIPPSDWNPSDEEYHRSVLTNTGRRAFRECPMAFWAQYYAPDVMQWAAEQNMPVPRGWLPGDDTRAQRIGSAVHCALLEPDVFPRRFWHDGAAYPRPAGAVRLTPSEWSDATGAHRAIKNALADTWAQHVQAWLDVKLDDRQRVRREWAIRADDPASGVNLKAKPDIILELDDGRIVMPDIKTVPQVEPSWLIRRRIRPFSMHDQPAHYEHVVRLRLDLPPSVPVIWLWVFISSRPIAGARHGVVVMQPDDSPGGLMEQARERLARDLDEFAGCMASGLWPPRILDYERCAKEFPTARDEWRSS